MKSFYVYILANKKDGVLYIGVTSDLVKRVYEHKNGLADGFTKKYKIHKLVYFEEAGNAESAITREKRLKKWNRAWKIALIEKDNPFWNDLYVNLVGDVDSRFRRADRAVPGDQAADRRSANRRGNDVERVQGSCVTSEVA